MSSSRPRPPTFPLRFNNYAPYANKIGELSAVGGDPPDVKQIAAALHRLQSKDGKDTLADACTRIEAELKEIEAMPEYKATGIARHAKVNPKLENLMTLALRKFPESLHKTILDHTNGGIKINSEGKVEIINPSGTYLESVAEMIKIVSIILENDVKKQLDVEMLALNAALKGFEDYKAANKQILLKQDINAKLSEYKGGLTPTAKEQMVAHLDQLSAVKCNNFFANLDKHRVMLLESKDDTSKNFKEIMGSKACSELITKLTTPNLSADGVRALVDAAYQVLLKQLHDPANHAKQVVINAIAAEMVDGGQPSIGADFAGQKALKTAFETIHLAVAQTIQKSGMAPEDYPKNDMAVLYALAQNVAEVIRDYTSKMRDGDKSQSEGHQNKMAEFERIQQAVAAQIAQYNGKNCAAIVEATKKIVHDSFTEKFDKFRIFDSKGLRGGVFDNAQKAMETLNTKLTNNAGLKTLLANTDGHKYVQAQQQIAAAKAAATAAPKPAAASATVKTAQRTPPTEDEKAKAKNNAAAAASASATGRPKTPPGNQRTRDTSPPKLTG